MKIKGYVDYRFHAPFIKASITLAELNTKIVLTLMIDTGSTNTLILWKDLEKLKIEFSKVEGVEKEFSGIGGMVKAREYEALIEFLTEEGEVISEKTRIYIVSTKCPNKRLKLLPSILGRDIINRYILHYNYISGEVSLEKYE